ncbi:cyclic nucleotide-binding-like protein [Catenaria anguillulae PL171]|uniref:Cyclic nucleotide-binding-like protein n=1 Tax=Catenaria anguillulae PL171 TaxID=765915 RepID=A0A1Y2HEQ7_9FUNG|nr:cyclic nucleotide-binding-like protein [Catenaria anguillulae PL171]
MDDPATHSPWYPMFMRRIFRALYSHFWIPASERLAPSMQNAFSNPNSRLWLALDIMVSLADLFYMIVIPVALAFVCDTPKGFTNVQFGVDIVMMFALVLDYHRPRRDKDIDTYAVAFTAVRLIRLLHISDTIVWFRIMRVSGLSRAISRLAKNLLAAAYISLWNAVLFWFLSSHLDSPKRYIVNYMFDPDTQSRLRLQNVSLGHMEMMLGAIVYVKSLDDQAEFDKTIKQRNFKKAYLRQYLIENQFPQSLQQRILDQEELDFALKKAKFRFFSKTSDMFKLALLERISTVSVQSGFYIFKAGDAGTDLFFIKRGSVQILTGDESKVIVTLQPVRRPDAQLSWIPLRAFFGEIALVEDCTRTATAKTASETQLCALSKPDFLEIMRAYPAMAELVHQHVKEKHEADARRKAEEERAKLEAAAKAALENQNQQNRSHHSGLLSGMLNRARNGTLSRHATLLRGGSGSKGPSLAGTLKVGTIKRQLMSRKDAVVGSIRSLASGPGGSRAGDDLKNLEASRHGLVSGGELQQMFTANRPLSEEGIAKVEDPDVR